MSALRLALRSYRDLYDRIWIMLLVSAAWWVLLITVIFAPPATLLLFKHADPRIGPWQDRPGLRESGEFLWAQFIRSWIVTLATLPIVALTAFNLDYYGSGVSALSFLSPLWLVLLLLTVTATLVIFALAAMTDLPAKQVIVTGARVTGARLPAALVVLLFTVIIPRTGHHGVVLRAPAAGGCDPGAGRNRLQHLRAQGHPSAPPRAKPADGRAPPREALRLIRQCVARLRG